MATIKGKWRWNELIDDNMYGDYQESVTFESNNEKFSSIRKMWTTGFNTIEYCDSSNKCVWFRACFEPKVEEINEKYRVMDFGETEQEIDDELYAFIVANATKITSLTIAEKLQLIAENEQKIYDAGEKAILDWFLPTSQGIEVKLTETIDSDGNNIGGASHAASSILFGPRYEYNNDTILVPVLYNFYSDSSSHDRNIDKYYYIGEKNINDILYDQWRKIELNGDYTWDSPQAVYVYTNKII